MEMDLTAAACVQPLRQNRALIRRRDGIFARRKPDIDIRARQALGEIRRRSIREARNVGACRLQLACDLRQQRPQRLRVVAQQNALTLLHGQRRDDALCERGIRNLLRPDADGDGQRQANGDAISKSGRANAHMGWSHSCQLSAVSCQLGRELKPRADMLIADSYYARKLQK